MRNNIIKRIAVLLMAFLCICPSLIAFADNSDGTVVLTTFIADGINVTRWADLLVVYKDIPTTEQNEYGHNCVIDANGVCTEIIEGGDIRGKNLAIPEGGMVVSATGNKVDQLKEYVKVGSYVRFDSVTMRVMVSQVDYFPVTFESNLPVTGYNDVRYADTVIIYNKSGQKTGTNGYGYEICVSEEGYIISAGGNDNTVPEGGYVVSVIEPDDINKLRSSGIVGASCTISADKKSVDIDYDDAAVKRRAEMVITELKQELQAAITSCRLIDKAEAEAKITAIEDYINNNDIATISAQAEIDALAKEAYAALYESKAVEVRAVWYEPLEKDAEGVAETVKKLKENGINQLCIGVQNSYNTIIPLPESFPFKQKTSLRGFDLLAEYVKQCHENGIEIVVCMPVFHNAKAYYKDEWATETNNGQKGEKDLFYSPANDEYFDYLLTFVEYLITRYDIDGLQLDYVRYPYFDGKTDYGYDENTKAKFEEETGINASVVDEIARQGTAHKNWNDWVNFKAGVITKRVSQINDLVDKHRPDIYLSTCLAADYDYLPSYCQNGKEWVESGIVDAIYPMSYATGIMASQTRYFSSFDADYYLIEGSGSYTSFSKDEQLLQVLETREYGADGIAFFEIGAYFSHRYNEYLNASVFSTEAVSPTYDPENAVKLYKETAVKRAEKACEYGFITEDILNAFKEDCSIDTLKEYSDTEWYGGIKYDIDMEEKINRIKKDTSFVLPEISDAEESEDISEGEKSDASTDESETESEKSSGIMIPVIIGIVCAAVIAAVVILFIKKK